MTPATSAQANTAILGCATEHKLVYHAVLTLGFQKIRGGSTNQEGSQLV